MYLSIYFIAINLVVLNRFWQFEAFYYDHGLYDSSLWQAAHWQIPYIDHLETQPIRQFGDHFTPTMYLLTPLYWITFSYEPILIIQNMMIVISAWLIFRLSTNKKLPGLLGFSIMVAYTLFVGLQNFAISNFHADGLALIFLPLSVLFMEKKKWVLFWVSLIFLLGTKQNFAAIGAGLGIYLLVRKEFARGLITVFLSLIYYLIVVSWIIPLLGYHKYLYTVSIPFNLSLISGLFDSPLKIQTLITSFFTFGWLPFFNPAFLPVIFQDFFTRFVINSGAARWDLGMHYNVTLAILLAVGSILGASWLMKFKIYQKLYYLHCLIIILTVLYFHQFVFHGPLGLALNPSFYRHTADFSFYKRFIKHIPNQGLVMVPNNIAPYLTHSHNLMLLRDQYWLWMPDVIAIDIRSGQNPANFWPLPPSSFINMQTDLSHDPRYHLTSNSTTEQLIYLKRV